MIVDPMQALADVPTIVKHATSSIAPIPTVIPTNLPVYQHAHDSGKRTLW